jgi:cytochrome b6-f complex iron-sulfur subunit
LNNTSTQEPTRRSFFSRLALWLGGLALGGSVFAAVRSLNPNVLYEPSKKVKVGSPEFIPDGVTLYKEARAFVFKKGEGAKTKLYAISAICTHLGCIVQHVGGEESTSSAKKESKAGFACPCHGSQFTIDGDVIKGPAPEPLPWLALSIAPDDGQLVVDTGTVVKKEKSLFVWEHSLGETRRA